MRKKILFVFGVLLGTSLMAQNHQISPNNLVGEEIESLVNSRSGVNTKNSFRAQRAKGDVVWLEDFSNGMPNDWVLGGADKDDCPWKFSKEGSKGPHNGNFYPDAAPGIRSETAANGFLICDVDSANNALYGSSTSKYKKLESYFTTSAIDLTNTPLVRLEFEQFFWFVDPTELTVSVSTDGISWEDYTARGNVLSNKLSGNPATFSVDVSSVIGGASTAYIRIGWATYAFFWIIDDLRLVAAPKNDLTLNSTYYETLEDDEVLTYYSKIPLSQAVKDTIKFNGVINNTGLLEQPNTKLENIITGPSGIANNFSSDAINLSPATIDTLSISTPFTFTEGKGNYSFVLSTKSDSVDHTPLDNILETVFVEVTDSTYARDRGALGNHTFGPGTSFEIGPIFNIYDTVKATSVSIEVGDESVVGEPISIYIYDQSRTMIAFREFVNLTENAVANLTTYSIPEVVLIPGKYLVTYKTYSDRVTTKRSNFSADPLTVFGRISGTEEWLFTRNVPVVRLNVSNDLLICNLQVDAFQSGSNSALATATNGTEPYTYLWSNSENTALASTLVSGQTHTVTVTDANGCEVIADVDITTGITEVEIEGDITLYPNPNNGEFQLGLSNVESGIYNISVKNIVGQVVYQNQINVSTNYNENIKVPNILRGVYFMEVLNNKGKSRTIKFIVK